MADASLVLIAALPLFSQGCVQRECPKDVSKVAGFGSVARV